MHGIVVGKSGRFILLVTLMSTLGGCASPGASKMAAKLSERTGSYSIARAEALRSDLMQVVQFFEQEISATADRIEAATQDTGVRRAALIWKLNFTRVVNGVSFEEREPLALLTDFWTFGIRQSKYLRTGEGAQLFKDQQPLAIEAATNMLGRIEQVAREHAPEAEAKETVRHIESFARDNPIRGVFEFELAERFSSGEEGESLLSRFIGAPWEWTKRTGSVLDPTSSLALSVDRFTDLMEDYPATVRWQTQLLLLQLEDSPTIKRTAKAIDGISESSVRLATVSETLPQDLRREIGLALDDIDTRQVEVRKTLSAVDAALERAERVSSTIERSIDGVTRAGEVWQKTAESVTDTVKQIQQFGTKPTSRPDDAETTRPRTNTPPAEADNKFDITDYERTADAITRTSKELASVLTELRSGLDEDGKIVQRIAGKTLAQSTVAANDVVDHFAWRVSQLSVLIFVLALGYRLILRRLSPTPS